MNIRNLSIAVICLAWVGCSSTSSKISSTSELKSIGQQKFGTDQFAIVVIPGSTGPINEAIVSGLSAGLGPSSLVRNIASNLQEIHARKLDVLFSGTSPEKTEKVIIDSLALQPEKSLSGMRMYVVGVEPIKIEAEAKKTGVNLVK